MAMPSDKVIVSLGLAKNPENMGRICLGSLDPKGDLMRGAGGTEGGIGRFFIGLIMIIGGGYLLLQSITVTHSFHFGYRLFSMGGFGITSGMVLIPFIFGVGIIFYNAKNPIGWLLAGGSLIALIFGVIASIHFRMQSMSLFDLLVILVLFVGGIGLFLSSLKAMNSGGSERGY